MIQIQKFKDYLIVLIISFFLIISGKTYALALSASEDALQIRDEIRENRCEALNNKIDARIQLFEQNKEFHKNIYEALIKKVENTIDWMSEKGLGINKLQSDSIVLSDLITKAWEDYSSFITLLMDTKNYTCGESQGQFRDKLLNALEQLKVYKSDLQSIKAFYKNTVKEDMKDIRDQYNELKQK
ncbi:MAG: hypothetical protein ACD_24C00157G0003 [uncultured bacterium]|uniref:Uncharacterized protein n=1 Tax=candidate division WWE3 bacterium RBG_16_37_10 TaxID=1802610 RepID=A0A1F4UVS2_UNCKA|nr:MAG: hypothetical protein ACD_24C00157G0003 [uncultured bacterium]OGC48293.1 MAG: hypothetical protein A2W32_03710 [candidate division WWE3 bacterium RBG_16_37_10]